MKSKFSYRKNSSRITIDLPRSAPIQIKPFPRIEELCQHWKKNRRYRTVVDVGCGKLRNALVLVKYFYLWIVDFEEVLNSPAVEERLNRLKSQKKFLGFVSASKFFSSRLKADAAVIAYVLHTLPTERLRCALIDSSVRNTRKPHELFVAVPNGEYYYRQRMGPKNRVGDGYFFGAGCGRKTFYRDYPVPEIDSLMKRRGFAPDTSFSADKKYQRTYTLGE